MASATLSRSPSGLWVVRPYALFRRVPIDRFWNLGMWCIPAGFVGGRLFYVVQNHPYAYFTHPWRAFQVWHPPGPQQISSPGRGVKAAP